MTNEMRQTYAQSKLRRIPNVLQAEAVIALIRRVTKRDDYAARFIIKPFETDNPYDSYRMYSEQNKIVIEANTGVAACAAFNAYLKKYCNSFYGPMTEHIELPDVPPAIAGIEESTSHFLYRYFFNYCTFSYTYLFADWADWERITDYMLLSGVNLYLNALGHEIVWRDLLRELGYSEKDIHHFICGPAYLPWQWMGNMTGFGGNLTENWFTKQKALSCRVTEKMRAFSAEVMLPGYYGMVPADFTEKFPNSTPVQQGPWCGFSRPALLVETDAMFPEMANLFYQKTKEHFGACRFFSADPFHEGGKTDGVNLAAFGVKLMEAMHRHHPDALWFFQGWQDNPKREMLMALDKDDVLVGCLTADATYYENTGYNGYPWLYLSTPNFGGTRKVSGNIYGLLNGPLEIVEHPEANDVIGVGMTMEGVEVNEIFYDLFSKVTFSSTQLTRDAYIEEFVKARYGYVNENLLEATVLLMDHVLTDTGRNTFGEKESSLCPRPDLKARKVCRWGMAEDVKYSKTALPRAVRCLLAEYERLKNNAAYRLDLMDMTRQIVADIGWEYIKKTDAAYDRFDYDGFLAWSKKYLGLFDLQETLMSANPLTRLDRWVNRAKAFGTTEHEKNMYAFNARNLLTLWAQKDIADKLHDYAHREWAGLIVPFYKKRWVAYFNTLEFYFEDRELLPEIDWKEFEYIFAMTDVDYEVPVCTDLQKAVADILAYTQEENA